MQVKLEPGKYVVAVSGGVDSVVLLDMLARQADAQSYELIVAHFDHGIRPDSAADRVFVAALAKTYGLDFIYEEARLGAGASEATARAARYTFLRRMLETTEANAIVTAHQQDDVLETAILNSVRGTARRGLTSLADRVDIKRPLLGTPRSVIEAYARKHSLSWREDSTNHDDHYRRNYIRHHVLPRYDAAARAKLIQLIERQRELNSEIDAMLDEQLGQQARSGTIERRYFNQLPHAVAKELLATWLRQNGLTSFDAKTIERLTVGAKTAQPGKRLMVLENRAISIGKDDLALVVFER